MDEVAENSDELMERYLEGEEISHEEIVAALKKGVTEGHLFPVTCGVATRNLGTNRLLEALVEDLPSPAMRGAVAALGADGEPVEIEPDEDGELRRLRRSRRPPTPTPGGSTCCASTPACLPPTRTSLNVTRRAKERIGQLSAPAGQGACGRSTSSAPGDIGAVAKLSETRPATCSAAKDATVRFRAARPAGAGDGVRLRAEVEGRRGEGGDARSGGSREEDPTLDVHRDPQTGEQIIAGLTQIHVEVIVDRMKEPLRGRDRAAPAAGPLPRDDPQAGQGARPLQEADRRPRPVRRLPDRDRAGRDRRAGSSSSTRSRAA